MSSSSNDKKDIKQVVGLIEEVEETNNSNNSNNSKNNLFPTSSISPLTPPVSITLNEEKIIFPNNIFEKKTFSYLLDDTIYCGHQIKVFLSLIPNCQTEFQTSFQSTSIQLIDEIFGRQFKYSSDFDTNGLLYYLGTKKYTTKYMNPYDIGMVSVEWSSQWPTHKYSSFVSNELIETGSCTKNIPNSWMMLSLQSNMHFIPTSYSLRHDIANHTHHLRSWILQAKEKINDTKWINISIHENDTSLNENNITATWSIEKIYQNDHNNSNNNNSNNNKVEYKSYQVFRILMTGPSNHLPEYDSWYLMCCGIEFYGTLIEL